MGPLKLGPGLPQLVGALGDPILERLVELQHGLLGALHLRDVMVDYEAEESAPGVIKKLALILTPSPPRRF